jgi:hypothetical protein
LQLLKYVRKETAKGLFAKSEKEKEKLEKELAKMQQKSAGKKSRRDNQQDLGKRQASLKEKWDNLSTDERDHWENLAAHANASPDDGDDEDERIVQYVPSSIAACFILTSSPQES